MFHFPSLYLLLVFLGPIFSPFWPPVVKRRGPASHCCSLRTSTNLDDPPSKALLLTVRQLETTKASKLRQMQPPEEKGWKLTNQVWKLCLISWFWFWWKLLALLYGALARLSFGATPPSLMVLFYIVLAGGIGWQLSLQSNMSGFHCWISKKVSNASIAKKIFLTSSVQ